jgi:membrane-associated protease RseP (regulator of RpoE activity)
MSSPSPVRGPARETRLLLLTLCVSVGVLFVLARFRFPERPISELAAPQPLARLARATTFDDLSATLTELLQRAGDASVALRVDGDTQPGGSRLVPALRVRDNLALAVLAGDARVEAVEGEAASSSASTAGNLVVARDEVRGLVLVRVPTRPAPALPVQPQGEMLELPGFLIIIDAAPGGPAIRAEFVSRATTHPHPAWDAPVLALGGIASARPGAMVFTLSGRFVGMVLPDDDETIVAPAEALIARADRLTRGESVLAANSGLAVQPLSPALAKATKAASGVIIAAITGAVIAPPGRTAADTNPTRPGSASKASATTPGTAAATAPPTGAVSLRVGDVIAAVDEEEIASVGDWERLLSRRAPGTTVQLRVVRRGATTRVPLMLTWRDAPLAPGDDGTAAAASAAAAAATAARKAAAAGRAAADPGIAAAGLTLRATSNGVAGLEVLRVDPGSAAARAGLHAGDRITALPGAFPEAVAAASAGTSAAAAAGTRASAARATSVALTVARVDAAFKAVASGDAMLLAISRAGQPLVVAVGKP